MIGKEFDDLVVRDSKGESTPDEFEHLRSAANVHRWVESLVRQRAAAQAHIAARRARLSKFAGECGVGQKGKPLPSAYLDRKREFDQQSQSTRRFIGGLTDRLVEAKQLARELKTIDGPSLLVSVMTVKSILDGSSSSDDPTADAISYIDSVLERIGLDNLGQ